MNISTHIQNDNTLCTMIFLLRKCEKRSVSKCCSCKFTRLYRNNYWSDLETETKNSEKCGRKTLPSPRHPIHDLTGSCF